MQEIGRTPNSMTMTVKYMENLDVRLAQSVGRRGGCPPCRFGPISCSLSLEDIAAIQMSETLERRHACVTGCGAVSPIGSSAGELWNGLLRGRSGLRPIAGFDTSGLSVVQAGEVEGFEPQRWLSNEEARRLGRIDQFALSAAREAVEDAGLNLATVDRSRVGLILGTSLGGMPIGEAYQAATARGAPFDARQLLHFPYYATANRLARELGLRGPVVSPSIACASGTQSVGMALELIRNDHADVFLVGGAEALSRFVVSGFNCLRATTTDTVRPFDARRSGLLLGEGAALLVVEERGYAVARGARTDVEVAGYGLAGDATHMTAPARDGSGAARAMRMALVDAAVGPEQVDFVSAHGTGTVYNDAMEIAAIRGVFGEAASRLPVNSIKGAIGHTLAAAGTFEAIMCASILRTGIIPPTTCCEQPDPTCGFDLVVGHARRRDVRVVLSTSSAFAGSNAAIVLRRAG
jgi:3-oxoacyl-[acyl-carrier-protein] synthase II